MLACETLDRVWYVIVVGWGLPSSDAENALIGRQPEPVQMVVADEDPKRFFARIDTLLNTLKSVGIVKEEQGIVRIITLNHSNQYVR